jgi:hypothetical protein
MNPFSLCVNCRSPLNEQYIKTGYYCPCRTYTIEECFQGED